MSETPLGKFRNVLNNTMENIESWIDDPEIEKYKLKIQTGLRFNIRDTVEYFLNEITPYANEILSGNDDFFLALDSNDIKGIDKSNMDEINKFFDKVKTYWLKLSKRKQNKLKDSFKLLIMLGAIATKNEKLRLIINRHRHKNNPLIY